MHEERKQTIGWFLLTFCFTFLIISYLQEPTKKQATQKQQAKQNFIEVIKGFFPSEKQDQTKDAPRLETNDVIYVFDAQKPVVRSTKFKNHYDEAQKLATLKDQAQLGIDWELATKHGKSLHARHLVFECKQNSPTKITFVYDEEQNTRIEICCFIENNILKRSIQVGSYWQGGTLLCYAKKETPNSARKLYANYKAKNDKTQELSAPSKGGKAFTQRKKVKDFKWASWHTAYFVQLLLLEDPATAYLGIQKTTKDRNTCKEVAYRIPFSTKSLQKGVTIGTLACANTYENLERVNQAYKGAQVESTYYYGPRPFAPVNKYIITPMFGFFYDMVPQPMLALFFVVLVLSLFSFFVTYKRYVVNIKIKAAKPFLEKIRRKKGAQAKIEESYFYRKVGINPFTLFLAGIFSICIFIPMYCFLMYSIVFRQQRFFWIPNVTHCDKTLLLPFTIPWVKIGHVSLLASFVFFGPILARLLFKEKQPTSTSNTAQTSKMMQYGMMIVFFWIMNGRSAIISIYRLFSMALDGIQSIICRMLVNKKKIEKEIAEKASQEDNTQQQPSRAQVRLEKRRKKKK